ncbi:MAG: peptidylprolyl isomerase, partial [Chthoniobacteraceae bacterium]|nr:peptidylprolyl isomerase [Chthoniobacteraceae bacterium]
MSSSPLRTFFFGLSLLLGLGNSLLLAEVREIATVVTSEGTMEFELYRDSSQLAVANFKYLADSHFYDGTKIHRLVKNFMAQGGDPGTVSDESVSNLYGTHGPEYSISNDPVDQVKFPLRKHAAGVLSMANSGGTATTGSQFFIMFAGNRPDLDAVHAQLGFIISGTSVLTALNDPNRELAAPSAEVMTRLGMNPLQEDVNIRPKIPIVVNSIRVRSEVVSGTLSTTFPVASDEGLLRDIQRNILGRWTVAVSSRGTFSGQLQCYDRTFAYTGRLVPVAGSTTESECVVHLDTKAASPIRVRIHLRRNGPTSGSLSVAVCKLTGTEVLLGDRAEDA